MSLKVKIDTFEGPFDLLYHLIETNEIDIYDIPIAELTNQYLNYLEGMKAEQLDIASEFLVMAATLLSIKSKMLLPIQQNTQVSLELAAGDEEADPREELVKRLIEYKKFKEVAKVLRAKEQSQSLIFTRTPTDFTKLFKEELPIYDISFEDLTEAIINLKKDKSPKDKVHIVPKDTLSLSNKIKEIYSIVSKSRNSVYFSNMIEKSPTASELILTLLAILELIKLDRVLAHQELLFGDIIVFCKDGEA